MLVPTLGLSLMLVSAAPFSGRPDDEDLDYTALAQRFAERYELDFGEGAGHEALEAFFDEGLVQFQLGAVDFRIPPAPLGDSVWSKEFKETFRGVAQVQARFLGWLPDAAAGKDGVPKDLKSSLKVVDKWLRDWKPNELVRLDDQPGVTLVEALAAREKVVEGTASFAELTVAKASFAGRKGETRLILIPGRADFVELCCFIGWVRPEVRHLFWDSDVRGWTYFDYEDSKVVALAFANPHAPDDYRASLEMNFKNEHALAQHVTQVAALSLIEASFGPRMDPALVGALANILVIDVFGQVDTRNDGDQRAKMTEEVSVFVPGALGDGSMPAVSADSRWRADQGADYFVRVLYQSQKDGSNEAESRSLKLATFPMVADDKVKEFNVHAPFLGSAAMVPPEDFLGDYIEFLRAYRVAFLYWLRAESQGSGKKSTAAFAELLAGLAKDETTPLIDLLERVYEKPLSSEIFDKKTLEGEFLGWLSKQK